MNNKFKKLINTAQEIQLSQEKKDSIRMRVESFMEMTPLRVSAPTSLRDRHYISKFSVLNFSKAVSFALIVLVAGGSTISYASEDSLPGDTFYTVKVNFTEPIQESLAFSQEAKLEVKTKQIEKRLTEAQTLLEKNDTTPEKHAQVEALVEKQAGEIAKSIDKLQEKGDVEAILNTTSKLQPVLKAHREALEEVSKPKAENQTDLAVAIVLTEEQEESTKNSAPATEVKSVTQTAEEIAIETDKVQKSENKSTAADNLLKTVERTIEQVQQKETQALDQVDQLEKEGLNINQVTTKKVEEASKEINDAKETIKKETDQMEVPTNESKDIDTLIDTSITTFDQNLKSDLRLLTITEAEILLEESKKLFEQGFYKLSLEKAQQALQITEGIVINQRIETLRESIRDIENQTKQEIAPEPEIEEIKTEAQIKAQEQASQAIQALEEQLSFNQ